MIIKYTLNTIKIDNLYISDLCTFLDVSFISLKI